MNIIKTKSFFLGLCVLLLLGCSKTELSSKRITGLWEIKKLKIINSNGITIETKAEGEIQFSQASKKDKNGTYVFNFQFSSPQMTDTINLSGEYTQLNQRRYQFKNDNLEDFLGEMVYYTKEDLQFELPNINYRGYYFILKRKK